MIIRIFILLFIVGSIGCARVSYKNGELNYSRWGDQKLEGFELTKRLDGTIEVKFDKQEGGEALIEALNVANEAIKRIPKLP